MESLKRRKVLEAIAAGFGATLLAGCGCDSDSGPAPNPPPPPAPRPDCWVVYPNPCDPRVLALVPGNGGRISLVGTKSATGDIQCAHRLLVTDASEKLSTVEFIPEENKLVGTAAGARVSVCAIGDGHWGISLLAGCAQLEVTVVPVPGEIPVGQQSGPARGGRHLQLDSQQHDCSACAGQSAVAASSAATANMTVIGCAGADADAFIYLRNENSALLDVAPAFAAGDNCFTAFLIDSNTPGDSFAAAAGKTHAFVQSFDSAENAFVSLLSKLKSTSAAALSNGMIAALKSQGRFAAVYEQFSACVGSTNVSDEQKIAAATAFFTKILGTLYLAVAFHDRLAQAANTDLANAYSQYKFNALKLQAAMTAGDGTQFAGAASSPVSVDGPFPVVSLDTARAATVSRIAFNPALPAAGQDYVASGVLSCLVAGDTVTASVDGTDGYRDSVALVIGTQGAVDVALAVPGAPPGTVDTIVVAVQRAGAEIARRTVSLASG